MTTIPNPTANRPCIQFRNDVWYAAYYEDDKKKLLSLGTSDRAEALALRDKFHTELLSKGATRTKRKSPAEKIEENPTRYIHKRDPYVVTIRGKVVGYAPTREDAEKLRDEYLAKL